jgi:hypothetical protein
MRILKIGLGVGFVVAPFVFVVWLLWRMSPEIVYGILVTVLCVSSLIVGTVLLDDL